MKYYAKIKDKGYRCVSSLSLQEVILELTTFCSSDILHAREMSERSPRGKVGEIDMVMIGLSKQGQTIPLMKYKSSQLLLGSRVST